MPRPVGSQNCTLRFVTAGAVAALGLASGCDTSGPGSVAPDATALVAVESTVSSCNFASTGGVSYFALPLAARSRVRVSVDSGAERRTSAATR